MKESFTTYTVGEKGERPWGTWQVLDLQSHVVVKKLLLVPGGRISLQRHNFRSERWIVTEGVATVRLDDVVKALEKAGLTITKIRQKEDWRCVTAKRGAV